MSLVMVVVFFSSRDIFLFVFLVVFFSFSFIWVRGTLPRMRYDRLMALTWQSFLPFSLVFLMYVVVFIALWI